MLAWFSGSPGPAGILAQAVDADGSPAGAPQTMPGTQRDGRRARALAHADRRAAEERRLLHRHAASATRRASKVRVWRVGVELDDAAGHGALDSPRPRSRPTPRAACGSVWTDGEFGDEHVIAARSNPAATRFGAPVDAGAVKNAHSLVLASTPARSRRRRSTCWPRSAVGDELDGLDLPHAHPARPDARPAKKQSGDRSRSPSPTPATRSRARRSRPAASPARPTPRAASCSTLKGKATRAGDRERATSLQS